MNSFVHSLQCPLCKRGLREKIIFRKRSNRLFFGFYACSCKEYPVVNGVVMCAETRITHMASYFLTRYGACLTIRDEVPFFLFRIPGPFFVVAHLLWLVTRWRIFVNMNFRSFLVFYFFVYPLKLSFIRYLLKGSAHKNTHTCQVFISGISKGLTILDFGCGSGNLLPFFRKRNPKYLCAVDVSIMPLYLAYKYNCFADVFIYLDGEKRLPLVDSRFSLVVANDSFHYIRRKVALAKELRRIITVEGRIVLTHTYNKRFDSQFSDKKRFAGTLHEYIRYFKPLRSKLFYEVEKRKLPICLEVVKPKHISRYKRLSAFFNMLFCRI